MRRVVRILMNLYPAPWRARYGGEFEALLEDAAVDWRTALNVVGSAISMRLTTFGFWITVALSVLGGAAAWGWSYRMPVQWISQSEFAWPGGPNAARAFESGRAPLISTNMDPRAGTITITYSPNRDRIILTQPVVDRTAGEHLSNRWSTTGLWLHFKDSEGAEIYPFLAFKLLRTGPNRLLISSVGFAAGLLLAACSQFTRRLMRV
jgi:hypothetical protein